jgi:hypothetical protein
MKLISLLAAATSGVVLANAAQAQTKLFQLGPQQSLLFLRDRSMKGAA